MTKLNIYVFSSNDDPVLHWSTDKWMDFLTIDEFRTKQRQASDIIRKAKDAKQAVRALRAAGFNIIRPNHP